jgi:hemolysin III
LFKLQKYLMDPLSALTHLVATGAALIGLVILIVLTRHDGPKMISLLVYGFCLVILYAASTLYHGVKLPEPKRMGLNRLDHAAIFLLIAGTYTPIVYNLFADPVRWPMLTAVWLAAGLGVILKLSSRRIHGFVNVAIYLILSWGGAIVAIFMAGLPTAVPANGLLLLLLGGIIYSVGFVTYYWHWPDPWPNIFGHHEVWHLFVIAASVSHFLFMLFYVVPVDRV